MTSIFCCSNTRGYKNRTLSHESKFITFLTWANFPQESSIIVKQTNYGPLDGKRYFVAADDGSFTEVTEQWLVDANFEKLNTFKNFRCLTHNKFFEVNIYQKDPANAHRWRANIARPAGDIDL
ncbi:hypothetical protein L13192_12410 [Pyrenophora tritici-repentis]|nr:hypothetical protein L13192_12410 [Pyrenophora tritici-repentis]